MTPPTQTAEAGKFRLIPRNIDFATWWDRVGILAVLAILTAFMAFDPQLRSTRSLDLQYRDGQWKVCEFVSG